MPNFAAPKKILVAIVDDHEPFRRSICILLERRGYETCSFGSVPEFIESRAMMRIDCLILDVGLPDIDGVSLQECLSHTNCQFPIIFCTGLEMDERLRNALANGASKVLRKPVNSDELVEAVREACAGQP